MLFHSSADSKAEAQQVFLCVFDSHIKSHFIEVYRETYGHVESQNQIQGSQWHHLMTRLSLITLKKVASSQITEFLVDIQVALDIFFLLALHVKWELWETVFTAIDWMALKKNVKHECKT